MAVFPCSHPPPPYLLHLDMPPLMPDNPASNATDLAFNLDRGAAFHNMSDRPALIRFVERPAVPQPGSDGYREYAKQVLMVGFYREVATIPDTLGERVMLAWRITRELARHLGVISSGESLVDALCPTHENLDPWTIPQGLPDPRPATPYSKQITATGDTALVRRMMDFHNIVPEELWAHKSPGLPVLPPINRDPDTDPLYKEWMYAIERVSTLLGLGAGTPSYPGVADKALPQLLFQNPEAWPTRGQMVAFEEILISETLGLFTEKSHRGAQQELFTRYGLLPHESKGMIEMARYSAMNLMNFDVDEARGLMVMRLESFVERSRDCLDMRAELSGLKQLAIIQGLARTESGDLITDFTDVVRSVSAAKTVSNTANLPAKDQK